MEITRVTFEAQRRPRFGTSNPERMHMQFWEWMIRGDDSPPADEGSVLIEYGMIIRRGIIKSRNGPYRARDRFQVPLNPEDGPIWTFDRMGQTRTKLRDGRLLYIGGEHEDRYDPDFNIYNDVIVFRPDDEIEIYGYPRDVFPPTDSHTATLIDDRIVVIGCNGYATDRCIERTPTFAVDVGDYKISKLETRGESPGWLFEHKAELGPDGVIKVSGGRSAEEKDGRWRFWQNIEEYSLDTRSGVWHRSTDRNWIQFMVLREDDGWLESKRRVIHRLKNGRLIETKPNLMREGLYPSGIRHVVEPCNERNQILFTVVDVRVSATKNGNAIEIIIEGVLPNDHPARIADEVRANVETACGARCILVSRR